MLSQNWPALFIGLVSVLLFVQYANAALWTPMPKSETLRRSALSRVQLRIQDSLSMRLNPSELTLDVVDIDGSVLLDIPFPDGEIIPFKLFNSDVLPAELSAKYPEIKAFSGYSTGEGEKLHAEVDYTPEKGFHAHIVGKGQDIYIDPFDTQNNEYKVYTRQEYQTASKKVPQAPWNCSTNGLHKHSDSSFDSLRDLQFPPQASVRYNQNQLRYRVAIATNAEYASYHGNTIQSVLAAIVTTMQRVNGIYKRSVGISIQLHPQIDELICFDPCSELSNNYDMFNEIEDFIDNKNIASDTYDFSHGFATFGGGIAVLNSICAYGTGLSSHAEPDGELFWVDYVAHEIAHQFGAYHTYSDCYAIGDHPVEPGSGSTIMSYAGLCDFTDIQSQSDPIFHTVSIEEMLEYIAERYSVLQCGELLNTLSPLPSGVLQSTCDVPHSTFFHIAMDPSTVDSNTTLYMFDQISEIFIEDQYMNKDVPIFRSWIPVKRSYRDFPNLFYILNNATDIVYDEILPNRPIKMTFRGAAFSEFVPNSSSLDSSTTLGFGGISYSNINVEFGAANSLPFKLSLSAKAQQWKYNNTITLEWTGGRPNDNLRMVVAKHDTNMDWNNFDVLSEVVDYENQIAELDWKQLASFSVGDVNSMNTVNVLLPNIYNEETTVHVMVYNDNSPGCYYFDIIPYIQYIN